MSCSETVFLCNSQSAADQLSTLSLFPVPTALISDHRLFKRVAVLQMVPSVTAITVLLHNCPNAKVVFVAKEAKRPTCFSDDGRH